MAFAAGTRLGPYEIVAPLGAGGMGEVWRARDTKLGRDVALKFLPAAFALDTTRTLRFRREAQLLASLNHPGIATIHGLEEIDGLPMLVLELVEGEDLAQRLTRGSIPLNEALEVARHVSEALEYAHERGIIHRDLKPANIKVRPDGTAKVLDFGLAKALEDPPVAADAHQSPTITAEGTAAGVILGTAGYMSPEQARGKQADRRADVWALGVCLYEMLSGRRAFEGDSVSEVLVAVLQGEPDWNALPPRAPVRVARLLRRCLEKDSRRRIQAIGEVRIAIEDAIAGTPEAETLAQHDLRLRTAGTQTSKRRAILLSVLGALAAMILTLWFHWPRTSPKLQGPMLLSVDLGAPVSIVAEYGPGAVFAPDGKLLAFAASKGPGEVAQLYVRRLDKLDALALPGTEGARDAFFSPDGQWLAFFADRKLKKIATSGGAPVTICGAPEARGGSWGDDGSIVFAAGSRNGLSLIPAGSVDSKQLTTLDEASNEQAHEWPTILPGGAAVLFTARSKSGSLQEASIVVQQLPSGPQKVVHRGGYQARYLPTGHLVFFYEETLFAVPFNLERLETMGRPVPILEGLVAHSSKGGVQVAFSSDGTLAYMPRQPGSDDVTLSWMDRGARTRPLLSIPGDYNNLRFSPDGRRIALDRSGGGQDIWLYDVERGGLSRLTFDPAEDTRPVWTPDGRRITFTSSRADETANNLYWQRADGSGEAQRLTESRNMQSPFSWHPSGRFLAFHELAAATQWDIWILPMDGDEAAGWTPRKPTVFLNSPFIEVEPTFSPDGRWLAYTADESGRREVYVRPFPGPGGKWQISTLGGSLPTWSRNGREILYRALDQRVMVAGYAVEGDTFRVEKPRPWSEEQLADRGQNRNYDLHPDGQRLAVLKVVDAHSEGRRSRLVFMFNFFDELRRAAPPALP